MKNIVRTRLELLDLLSIEGAQVGLHNDYAYTHWWVRYNDEGWQENGPSGKRVNANAARACIHRGELVWSRELSEWPLMIFTPNIAKGNLKGRSV